MEVSHALDGMWNDAAGLIADEGWVIRIAFIAFLLLPIVAVALVFRFRSRRALIALGIWSWYFGWWFLQYAIDSWTNPGGPGTFLLMMLAIIVGWTLLASEIRHRQKAQSTTSVAAPIAH